jgi:hypothetical protein
MQIDSLIEHVYVLRRAVRTVRGPASMLSLCQGNGLSLYSRGYVSERMRSDADRTAMLSVFASVAVALKLSSSWTMMTVTTMKMTMTM